MPARPRAVFLTLFALLAWQLWSQTRQDEAWSPRLILEILDAATGQPTAARFTVTAKGQEHEPRWVGTHGLRYVSVHVSKKQTYIVTAARGTGPVEVPLPPGAERVRIDIAKGFDYFPLSLQAKVEGDPVRLTARLKRWNRLHEDGWRAADAHLHYDRPSPEADRDWFHLMAADGLDFAQFMLLKGGMVPGVWARQYAYGRHGEHSNRRQTIIPGMEYRDRLQGHVLLFGSSEVIPPIMAGTPEAPHNWPTFFDVLERARRGGALVGPAHGGTLSRSPTAVADALLGAVDFWEIGNAHLWELEDWYKLMNIGVILPPMAGTDLPNNPYRDPWQPFLGSMRTYTRTGVATGSDVWNDIVRRGEVFVTSGPLIELSVNGEGPGGTVRLPSGGGEVTVKARLESPRSLDNLEIIRNDEAPEVAEGSKKGAEVNQIVIERKLQFQKSGWIAARGRGGPIEAISQHEVAHTAAVRVLVGDEPIRSEQTVSELLSRLHHQKQFYASNGSYPDPAARAKMLEIFDRAAERLQSAQAP